MLGDEAAMAALRCRLAAEQTSAVEELAIQLFLDLAASKQLEKPGFVFRPIDLAFLVSGQDLPAGREPREVDGLDAADDLQEVGEVAALGEAGELRGVVQPHVHEPRHADARRFLARHWLDRGEPAAARPHADKLVSIARDDFRSHYLRSRVFAGLDMWEEAISAGRRAIALNPEFVYAYNNVGFAALQVGRDVLAVQYLEAASELSPIEPYMLNNLGVAYERMDRNGDALAVWARAASLDPSYVKAVANRDRMQVIVDQEVADEVARILAARKGAEEPTDTVASGILTP